VISSGRTCKHPSQPNEQMFSFRKPSNTWRKINRGQSKEEKKEFQTPRHFFRITNCKKADTVHSVQETEFCEK
jgi:hypothetical protein